jgi:hypothetical protein
MSQEIQDDVRREKLRATFEALSDLELQCPVTALMPESLAVESARESLRDAFGKDVAGSCEGCGCILLTGDQGQRCIDGELLCAPCSATWGEIKRQWDDGEISDDEGNRARFMSNFDAHIAGGGKPDDLMTYPL